MRGQPLSLAGSPDGKDFLYTHGNPFSCSWAFVELSSFVQDSASALVSTTTSREEVFAEKATVGERQVRRQGRPAPGTVVFCPML